MPEIRCFHCQKMQSFVAPLGLRETCQSCDADLHSCRSCLHYDPKIYNECKETQADVVREKERANFCDYFSAGNASGAAGSEKQDLLAAAEALFKRK